MKDYSNKILELSRRDVKDNEKALVAEAMEYYVQGEYEKIDEVLTKLDTDYQLLNALVEKLKGKSVYTNLKKLIEGKDQSIEQQIISIGSLISHTAIEMKEHKEYKKLLPDLYRKLGVLINNGN